MSFILEALKKSEKNRQEATTPTLETQHDNSPPAPRKRPLWPLLLLVILLLNAAVLLWLFGPWHDTDTVTEVAPAPTRVEPTPAQTASVDPVAPTTPPAPMTPPTPEPVVAAPAVMPEPQVVATLPPAVAPADATVAQTIVNTQAVATVQQPAPAAKPAPVPATETVATPAQITTPQVVSHTATPPPAPQPPARNVLALTELPGSIQQQLPRLHLSVHAYTGDQNTSLIRLNDRIMRAGNYLDDRYRLEEITSDGAIFSYQGYYFLVPRRGA
ncbi:MAG: hypothetical protein C0620_12385 [Desulfuromonas sp.]|nr:MAG: hypothetical protein C0620_12385 [Desulfuromonas sp.]